MRFVDPREKAHVPGLGGQTFDEGVFTLAVFIRQLPDQHVTAILKGFDPVLAFDFGTGFSSPIMMIFDSEHRAILRPVSRVGAQ
ncbi:hypothetical protein D3C73_1552290 [compost metagenome]